MTQATDPLDFTGERFTPECQREIWYEHYHRYALASRWCKGLRTLDAACGEGYGSALLSRSAASVEALDISEAAIEHARQRYGDVSNLNFQVADCTVLPFVDNEFDCIMSFETLEHLEAQDQLLSEFRRVLKPGGFLALSSPDKAIYTDKYQTDNEFHVKELYRDELESLIQRHFGAYQLLGQKLAFHSAIWSLDATASVVDDAADSAMESVPDSAVESGVDSSADSVVNRVSLDQIKNDQHSTPTSINQPAMYFIALCAESAEYLPPASNQLWLFDDFEESVYRHYYGEIGRNMAAGGVIVGLENQISKLQKQLTERQLDERQPRSWWQRLISKS